MTGLRYVSQISTTVTRFTYVYSLFDLRNGGPLLYQSLLLFLTLRGGSYIRPFLITAVAHFVLRPVWTLGLKTRNIN